MSNLRTLGALLTALITTHSVTVRANDNICDATLTAKNIGTGHSLPVVNGVTYTEGESLVHISYQHSDGRLVTDSHDGRIGFSRTHGSISNSRDIPRPDNYSRFTASHRFNNGLMNVNALRPNGNTLHAFMACPDGSINIQSITFSTQMAFEPNEQQEEHRSACNATLTARSIATDDILPRYQGKTYSNNASLVHIAYEFSDGSRVLDSDDGHIGFSRSFDISRDTKEIPRPHSYSEFTAANRFKNGEMQVTPVRNGDNTLNAFLSCNNASENIQSITFSTGSLTQSLLEFRGEIQRIDRQHDTLTFSLEGRVFHVTQDTQYDDGDRASLTLGRAVDIEAIAAQDGSLQAIIVDFEPARTGSGGGSPETEPGEPPEIELEGWVQNYDENERFQINGRTILLTNGTEFENGTRADLRNGIWIEVDAWIGSGGTLTANYIYIEGQP